MLDRLQLMRRSTFSTFTGFTSLQLACHIVCLIWISTLKKHVSRGALAVGLPPAWVDVSEEISENMQHARAKMSELAKAHTKALMPSFADSREDHHAIEVLTHEITDLLRK